MNLSRHRRLIYGLYLIALIAIVALAWRTMRRPRPTLSFSKIDVEALNARSSRRAFEPKSWPLVPEVPIEWREYLTKDEAALLVPSLLSSPLFTYDPWMYVLGAPNRRDSLPLSEHPKGRVTLTSNAARLRGTIELAEVRPDLRLLVAGDSHTYGVCDADETFSGLLLRSLSTRQPDKTVEVLNAGYGGYSFYNYVGTLLHWRGRAPQVMIVAVFGGNDFAEALPFLHFFAGDELSPWTREELDVANRAGKVARYAMAQGLYSAYFFHCRPHEADRAVEAGVGAMSELRAIGDQLGTSLVVCFLPNACAQPFDPPLAQIEAASAILREKGFDMAVQTAAEEQFVQRLRTEGIELVDMRPIFAAETAPPFWREDLHLSLRGHELVAKELEPIVHRLLER